MRSRRAGSIATSDHGSTGDADSPRWTLKEVGLVAAVTTAVASVSLTQTLSVPMLPMLARRFENDVATVSWIATATLIASAVSSPIVGRLGDMFGKRMMAFGCLAVTLGASIVGVFVESLAGLLAVRFAQGGGAGVIPLTFGILRDQVSSRRYVAASSAVMVGGVGVGAGAGPIVAAFVLDAHGIGAGFWLSAAAVALAIVLMVAFTSPSSVRFPARFDVIGAVGLSVVLVASMLALTKAPQWGWTSVPVLSLFAIAAVVGLLWYRWESSVAEPAIDIAVSSSGPVLVAHLGGIVAGFSSFAQYIFIVTIVSLPRETGYGLGRTVSVAGLVQLPGVVVLSVSVVAAASAVARWGAHNVLCAGAAVLTLGFLLAAFRHGSLGELVLSVVFVNAGLGPIFCALPILIHDVVDVSETSAVNAVNALARQVGSVTASAFAGSILATSSVVVAGAAYPARWAFVAIGAVAAAGAGALALLTFRLGRRARGRSREVALNCEDTAHTRP